MARLTCLGWASTNVAMNVKGAVAIPEPTLLPQWKISPSPPLEPLFIYPSSPMDYQDSCSSSSTGITSPSGHAIMEHPTSCSPVPSRLLLFGGPGFSIAAVDATCGNPEAALQHVPIPLPLPGSSKTLDFHQFSSASILSMAIVGEGQVWAATETASLHVFDLSPELRLANHHFTILPASIHCITAARHGLGLEVLLGSATGQLVSISGHQDSRGHMKSPLKCLRKIVQLGLSESSCRVCAIAHTRNTYWCACGPSVVVLTRAERKEVTRLHSRPVLSEEAEVVQLLACESGVWSALSHCSTITLWDSLAFAPKLHIACCDINLRDGISMGSEVDITCLSFSYPLLLVGTEGGHVLVLKLLADSPSLEYKLLTGRHCSSEPIVAIQPTQLQADGCHGNLESPPATPNASTALLLVAAPRQPPDDSPAASHLLLLELLASPPHSPPVSPGQLSPACLTSSVSLQGLTTLPKLVLSDAAEKAALLIPLHSAD